MKKCKKGSCQWKKYNKAKRYLLSKTKTQLRDALHKISRKFVNWCAEQQIKHVIIGDVKGVQRHTRKKRGKTVNQKLAQWQFGQLLKYLEYKLQAKGITLEKVNEAYSSQTCPVCTRRKKPSGRVYKCKCGYEQHRDIHGAKYPDQRIVWTVSANENPIDKVSTDRLEREVVEGLDRPSPSGVCC
jgi:putative transposase